jgi:hypothetical protein
MTLLKEKLQTAGINLAASRLATLAFMALHECHGDISAAADALFGMLSKEPRVAKEALLKPYLIQRQADMRGSQPQVSEPAPARVERRRPDPQQRRAVAQIVHSAVDAIHFKHLTSDGRDWATVGAHELIGMDRDGKLASAIKDRLGALSNAQQVKPIGELMTRAIFNEVRTSLEGQP